MPMTAALVWRRSKRAPWRALFLIFLLSGVNLEANIGITSEQEKKAVARAKTIADLDESAYAELLSKNQAALTELPIVNSCKLVQVTKLNNSFCSVNLNCTMRCGLEQQPKLRLSQKCPTTAQAAELMLEYLQNNHAECISSARNACSCCATDEQGGSISAASVNAFSRMQETQRQAAQQRAAELRLRTAEQDLERVKRLRTASSNADRAGSGKESQEKASQDHQAIPYFDKYKNWDLSQFRTRMGEAMRRRSTLLSKEATRPEPRDDGSAENDALYHWRRGLIGAIQDWADGSLENAVVLVARLVRHFDSRFPGFKGQVLHKLSEKQGAEEKAAKIAALHAEMISTAREAIRVLKGLSDDAHVRSEYLAALALFAPEASSGREYAFAKELGVNTGERKTARTGEKRPRAFRRAMQIRAQFRDHQAQIAGRSFTAGDPVLCRGERAILHEIREDGGCTVKFGANSTEKCVEYASMTREPKKSGVPTKQPCARLQHIPPSLLPARRQTRSDATSEDVKAAVREVYENNCATSPHQRDSVTRRLSRFVVEKAQALIMNSTFHELYQSFQRAHDGVRLSVSMFKRLAPWNLKRAYRETCVCRCCELFRLYQEALHTVADLLAPLIPSSEERDDVEEANEDNGEDAQHDSADEALCELLKFCKLDSKSKMAEQLVCGGKIESARNDCIRGRCASCGFRRMWSDGPHGLRRKLVDENGKLQPGIAPVWQTALKWETLKSGKSTPSDGSSAEERDGLRERKEGTPIQFLDDFAAASVKFPAHRFLVHDVKRAAKQRDQHFWPGMLVANYDWSENGTILNAIQIQSEYWSLVHYSLFICITSYLVPEAWCSRSSVLPIGAAVTVEPEGISVPDSLEPALGSYFATVVRCPPQANTDTHSDPGNPWDTYVVQVSQDPNVPPVTVPRERLRHRKLHTTAFVCITDDKRHDSVTTQHMLKKQFDYWKQRQDEMNPFWAWVGHSDNASHFKSGSMLNFWSRVRNDGWLKSVWIEFGCPGHGKGPWDGMGAVIKQQLTRDLTNNKILTDDGYVTCPREAAEHLRRRFDTDEWRERHKDKAINEIKVMYSNHEEIDRPPVEHEFDALDGKMSSYSYMILAQDQIARRENSCWCEACFHARGRLNMHSDGSELRAEGCLANPWEQMWVRDKGTGLAGRRREAQARGKQLAQKLKAAKNGDHCAGFMAIQARETWSTSDDTHYRPGHFWLAQAPDVLDVRRIDTRGSIEGTMFSPGDYLIRIGRYFDRKASDPSGLTFEEWTPPHDGVGACGSFIINATELRAVNFSMLPVKKPLLVEVRRRSSPRLGSVVVSVPPPPPPKEYTMPQQIDDEIRAACW